MSQSESSNGKGPMEFAENERSAEGPPGPCSDYPLDGKTVLVLSRLQFQSDLLNMYLAGQAGARCRSFKDPPALMTCIIDNTPQNRLVLWDCHLKSRDSILAELTAEGHDALRRCPVCLFNVPHTSEVEMDAIQLGVRGFFYEGDPIEHLCRGVYCVFEGQLWFRREIMQRFIARRSRAPGATDRTA